MGQQVKNNSKVKINILSRKRKQKKLLVLDPKSSDLIMSKLTGVEYTP